MFTPSGGGQKPTSNQAGMPGMGDIPPEALAQMMGGAAGGSNQQKSGARSNSTAPQQHAPSETGTVFEEITGMGSQFSQELKSFFSLNWWMGVDPNGNKSPEDQAKARQIHSRYQQLDQEQQQVARQMYQEKIQKQRMREQEEQRRKQRNAQENQGFSMPSSPKKGPVGPSGNKKQQAQQKVQKSRNMNDSTQGE